MPLNLQSFERRTGYIPVPLFTPGATDLVQLGWAAKWPDGSEYARYLHADSQKALEGLAEHVYRLHIAEVFSAQEYRCVDCGERKELDPDHIIPRSRGRLDTRENIAGRCRSCHQKRHNKGELCLTQTAST